MRLYEIAQDYKEILEAIEYGIIPEEAIADTLEAIEGEFHEKVDNIASFIKGLKVDIAGLKAEEDALRERRNAKIKKVEYLTEYLSNMLTELDIKQMETVRNKISFRKSSRVTIIGEEEFIEWAKDEAPDLLKFSEPEISLAAVKNAIKSGRQLQGVMIEAYDNIQLK